MHPFSCDSHRPHFINGHPNLYTYWNDSNTCTYTYTSYHIFILNFKQTIWSILVSCICDFCRGVHAIIAVVFWWCLVKLLAYGTVPSHKVPLQWNLVASLVSTLASWSWCSFHASSCGYVALLLHAAFARTAWCNCIALAFRSFHSPNELKEKPGCLDEGVLLPLLSFIGGIKITPLLESLSSNQYGMGSLEGVFGASCQVVYSFAGGSSVHVDPKTICLSRWTWPLVETGFSDRFSFGGDGGRNKMDLEKGQCKNPHSRRGYARHPKYHVRPLDPWII